MRSILLIDDKEETLRELEASLRSELSSDSDCIKTWAPTQGDRDARAAFEKRIEPETMLVITDSDLTSQGRTGLFGASIVAWCQQRALPVGDYSRKVDQLPKTPELFELRVPADPKDAIPFIAAVYKGFCDIDEKLAASPELLEKRSPAAVLATLLGEPEIEGQLSLYARIGAANGALMDRVEPSPSLEEKRKLLGYIVGHLLLNVLRFPGPILSLRALKAYLATDEADAEDVTKLFAPARYSGPFAEMDRYYWLSGVDSELDELAKALPADYEAETTGEFNRASLEKALSRKLERHECPRCQGRNGGFFCPFTQRTVCQRTDCSVGSNSWIPQGARVCRIERDFFEEWAPILGL